MKNSTERPRNFYIPVDRQNKLIRGFGEGKMSKVRIVTDRASDLPDNIAAKYGIEIEKWTSLLGKTYIMVEKELL